MLVLSRRISDRIEFPELDITIEILQVKGSNVRVGIDAPIEIKILRGEIDDKSRLNQRFVIGDGGRHEIRNQLNTLTIATAVAKRLVDQGKSKMAANVLHKMFEQLDTQNLTAGTDECHESSVSVLVIEDVTNERELLAGFLRLHGFSVDTVKDGVEALNFLENVGKPDILLMDMNLPRMDGADAIREIRANPAFDNLKIFAVSGNTSKESGLDPVENRVAEWFQKPLELSGFISTLNAHTAQLAEL